MKIGDPMDPATQVGALISKEHCEKVLGYIERGRREGAAVAAGGGRPDDPALAKGNFVQPTVFAGCRDDMGIVRSEEHTSELPSLKRTSYAVLCLKKK